MSLIRSLVDLNREGRRLKAMVRDGCSVGHVVRSILRSIVYRVRVEDLKVTVHRKHKLLGMLGKKILVSMQHWIIGRWVTKHLSSRWMASFLIILFKFLLTLDLVIVMLMLT